MTFTTRSILTFDSLKIQIFFKGGKSSFFPLLLHVKAFRKREKKLFWCPKFSIRICLVFQQIENRFHEIFVVGIIDKIKNMSTKYNLLIQFCNKNFVKLQTWFKWTWQNCHSSFPLPVIKPKRKFQLKWGSKIHAIFPVWSFFMHNFNLDYNV